ncbi:hypothetical protein Pint_21781 [Pistacia integerrima]|uniref:Uncharacterized protein n=1 Tax=Pistacia integerrima TaxID=434235 RepID=A0ACC0XB57_9ROSI|nr:hypothetical protein Pint_21781 [Pistacia integerrima]
MAIGLSAYVNISEGFNLSGTPFTFSHKLSKFISRGCNNYTKTFDRYQIKSTNGCLPICTCDPAKNHNCYDFMCTISSSHQFFSDISVPRNCKSAVMVEQDWLKTNYLATTNPNVLNEREHVPVVMEFGRYMGSFSQEEIVMNQAAQVDGKPTCYPAKAFMAPSESPGKNKAISIGLSAALGTLSLSIGAQSLYNFVKRMIANKVKQIFFKKMARATDSYNESRILGQGGQGTVYKGMLKEGRIIAVKRLKKVAERVDLFIDKETEQNRLFEILDAGVSKDDREQEIMTFANLTRRCLDSNGSKRPTMREAATELAGIRTSNGASNPKQDPKEIDCVEIEITYEVEISSSHTESILESINSLCF